MNLWGHTATGSSVHLVSRLGISAKVVVGHYTVRVAEKLFAGPACAMREILNNTGSCAGAFLP